MNAITFPAAVSKIQTLADGGLRFTFDVPETEALAAAQLIECKRWGVTGNVTFVPDAAESSGIQQNAERQTISARRKRQPRRAAQERPAAD